MRLRPRFRSRGPADQPTLSIRPGIAKPGEWSPTEIDFAQDTQDWAALGEAEQDFLLRLIALGQAAFDAVASDRLPLVMMSGDEQRVDEELQLTSYIWEGSKHAEIFRRFGVEIAPGTDPSCCRSEGQRQIVQVELPAVLERLESDDSPLTQAEAFVTYNFIVIGMLTETGYEALLAALDARRIMPGLRRALSFLLNDTDRHLARSVAHLSQLVTENGHNVRVAAFKRAFALEPSSLAAIEETFTAAEGASFGLDVGHFSAIAKARLADRLSGLGDPAH